VLIRNILFIGVFQESLMKSTVCGNGFFFKFNDLSTPIKHLFPQAITGFQNSTIYNIPPCCSPITFFLPPPFFFLAKLDYGSLLLERRGLNN